ncbi:MULTISPECIES: 3-hydroxyacyl-CoA dehydrogenase family protein [Citrobacter]|uniref:3-hydroxyacyl-CoA dehydrogenase family protein n=1 Tax=Citrobacter TaxID=544 RepID=UPI000846B0E3|nr:MULTISPECIES: 3-hydroxyacyl-CoA dehydrogenase family protein [Citrobacter]MBQ4924600.1 3-hydroxyacyl-CoA dehydrogenase family protein [Citrobacter werkmanii]MBQ4937337.1 3-hydroxyacyl-CoA dehydrogenase family protein [Citrobacter werkmanii]MBQ4950050.1 3-hydroxyacyl-CoA dehydrogenase family protein [Citrobacter werkmanii]MBQ4965874.1 3-hydroxyacyl-CoA dehydrogenase family protein [Citrobacter werkmanii]MDM3295612.1 3-hydroxyacyl-CoA dehydrogenase family protein [Citrobacter sp. Cc139]
MKNKQICVLGAGLMGVGIATHFARFGHDIWLYDTDSSRIAEISLIASGIVDELIATEQFALSEKTSVMNRLHGTTSLQDIAACGLLIEAIPERLELKHALYAQLEELIAPEAVIASNTSGLPPDALAEKLAYPERLLIAHFWNPPHFIPLVEIVPGTATKAEYLHELQQLLLSMQLEAVVLDRAAPGFVGNRLQFALLREALHIVKSGIASAEVVDQVMRASLGRRYAMVGPLEAADMTGLSTVQDICQHLLPTLATGSDMMSLVADKVANGDTGLRSGQGFYRWDDSRKEYIQQRREYQLRFALNP